MSHEGKYYVPSPSAWPIIGSIGLSLIVLGVANWLHSHAWGVYAALLGVLITLYMVVGWFREVIKESQSGYFKNKTADRVFRSGMIWFIFSEVMFFAVFFGSLFYVRWYVIPWLGGHRHEDYLTHMILWPHFKSAWPLLYNPDPSQFAGSNGAMETWHLPVVNTLLLLTSGVTLTIAHWGLIQKKRVKALLFQALTVLLGVLFLVCQVHEYGIAYFEKGLRLSSGIFGSLFFMMTGFHGLHVTLGTIMLTVIFFRLLRNHFDPNHHFAFEAVAWYWHFVDIVWLGLFIFVYWF